MSDKLILCDESIDKLATAIAAKMGSGGKADKPIDKAKKDKGDKKVLKGSKLKKAKAALIELCSDLKEASDNKTMKAVLAEHDFKSPKHVDDGKILEVTEAVQEKIDELGEGSGDEPDDEKVTEAQEAYQTYIDDNSKKEGKAILAQFGIKKSDDIASLDEEDLKELLEELE